MLFLLCIYIVHQLYSTPCNTITKKSLQFISRRAPAILLLLCLFVTPVVHLVTQSHKKSLIELTQSAAFPSVYVHQLNTLCRCILQISKNCAKLSQCRLSPEYKCPSSSTVGLLSGEIFSDNPLLILPILLILAAQIDLTPPPLLKHVTHDMFVR